MLVVQPSYSTKTDDTRLEILIPANDFVVTTTGDSGEGSLRQAMLNANAIVGADEIRFDSKVGPFGPPQRIIIEKPLPKITEQVTIDGYVGGFLWRAAGVTISGGDQHRIFSIPQGTTARIMNLTLADGKAYHGGAVFNRGDLVVSGVKMTNNQARGAGGAIFNKGGKIDVINSTFVSNQAKKGGAVASSSGGKITITNSTFNENIAQKGGAVFSTDPLLLRNTIVANSDAPEDCFSSGAALTGSTHNIIENNNGCPGLLFEADPNFERMDYFNGMTQTIALGMRSLGINAGSNESAVDENGDPLQWDQRGNGDPRFVAGYTDIGAFETQVFPTLVVDTLEDNGQQGCGGAAGDCPLRAAIRLAEVSGKPEVITFSPQAFRDSNTIVLNHQIPTPTTEMLIDGSAVTGLAVRMHDNSSVFESELPDTVSLIEIELIENSDE